MFEALLPGLDQPFPYRFRVHGWGDPIGNGGPLPVRPASWANWTSTSWPKAPTCACTRSWAPTRRLREGVAGVEFAVWAPNARRVSVVGQFNNWDGRRHLMRRFSSSGVWELFVPGMAPGDLYKFELKSADGRMLPLKADPFAFRCEHAPGTASVVAGSRRHAWGDGGWMAGRWERNRYDAPISLYEVHLGSWRRREDGRLPQLPGAGRPAHPLRPVDGLHPPRSCCR